MTPEETLESIKKEITELIEIEEMKVQHHKHLSGKVRSEYFYRGRLSYMKHLLYIIDNRGSIRT
jgi:hypothetical protein